MKIPVVFLMLSSVVLALSSCSPNPEATNKKVAEPAPVEKPDYALVIHGGAGTILKKNMTPEKETAILEVLNKALDTGEAILKNGGSSADAVEKTIMLLENSPYFNAGKGAVFTNAGKNELDASFMDGRTRNAGAVGGVTNVKNPIRAARAVMDKSEHVLLTGLGAEQFAKEVGLELVDPDYFYTESRWNSLQRAKEKEGPTGMIDPLDQSTKFGTVGAAALDKAGNLAAGTSTGGMTNKRYNRLGDSPIIGAGTYANNNTCAVSCTGHGEYFIRYAVAYDVSAMMEYGGTDFQTASDKVINEKLKTAGGSGGFIGVDHLGNVAMPFNTAGMYRGYTKPGERVVKIYED
ncbi:MAG: isoaspartyl peptidase/L-asparaginase [Bacteroidota bacterium]